MSTRPRTGPSTAERRAELRAEMDARIQQHRQRPLPGWLAGRRNRRALALLPLLTLALGAFAAAARDETLGIVLMLGVVLLGAGGVLVLRRATRMLDTAPEGLLDEREVGDRDRAHRRAFPLVVALLGALVVLAVVDGFAAGATGAPLFADDGWIHLTLASFLTAGMLPAATLAWNWRAPLDDLDD